MAFKTLQEYNENVAKNFFLLKDDGDFADVIILYPNVDAVLIADTHYVKSADYSGYVHCTGKGCPACAKGIKVQTKLFIPVYNLEANEIQFFDRSAKFGAQLNEQVFEKFSNPSEYVFRITRHGVARSLDTTYTFEVKAKNAYKSYATILAENNVKFPDYFESVCRTVTATELNSMVNPGAGTLPSYTNSNSNLHNYQVTPRRSPVTNRYPEIPEDMSVEFDEVNDSDEVASFDVDQPEF